MKRCIKWLFFLAVLTVLPLPAMAHPGKTDGSGGHTDRSTGEYHYHHGYGEHDHYDMNGDGVVDCPYNFDDQTNHNSGSSGNSSSGNSTYPQPSTQSTVPKIVIATAPAEEIETEEEVKTVPIWVYCIFFAFAYIFFCMCRSIHRKNAEIKIMDERHNKRVQEIIQKNRQEWSEKEKKLLADSEHQRKRLESQLKEKDMLFSAAEAKWEKSEKKLHFVYQNMNTGDTYLPDGPVVSGSFRKIEIPDDVFFTEDHVPAKGSITKSAPFGTYTVYVASKSTIFHTNTHCVNTTVRPVHIFEAAKKCRPCIKCGYGYTRSIPEWYTQLQSVLGRSNIRYVKEQANFISLSGNEEDLEYYKDALEEDLTVANNKHILFDDDITIADMEELALEMGVSLSVAKRIVNLERSAVGSPMIK